jgi:hypothetical protein
MPFILATSACAAGDHREILIDAKSQVIHAAPSSRFAPVSKSRSISSRVDKRASVWVTIHS